MKVKVICIALTMLLMMSYVSAIAVTSDVAEVFSCVFDTYTDNREKGISYDENKILLVGSLYNRTAFLKFDVTGIAEKETLGALLEITVRNTTPEAVLNVYSYDETKENITESYELLISAPLSNTGKYSIDLVVNKYIEKLKASGEKFANFAITCDAEILSIFSSENGEKNSRPKLKTTFEEAYVKGQRDFEYPVVTKETLAKDIKKGISDGHPYLFGRQEDFDRVKSLCFGGDENLTKWYKQVKGEATKYIGVAPVPITGDLSVTSYISRGSAAKEIVLNCAFVYLMEGDTTYAERAYKEAEYFCDMPTWGTLQYIDNHQLASSVAFCYDWLYDYLDETRRDKLIEAIKTKHLDTILDLYRNPKASKYNTTFYQAPLGASNMAMLSNTSAFMEALAFADVDIEYSAEIMSLSLEALKKPLNLMYPDGAWPEGLGYWSFVGPYIGRMFSSMESALGTWYGWEKVTLVMRACDFPLYAQSTLNPVMYSDSGAAKDYSPEKFYFGKMLNDISLQSYTMDTANINSPLICLWYNPKTDYNAEIKLSKDKLFRNLDMAVMRGPFEGEQEIFGAMTTGVCGGHGYADKGTITVDALGTMWVTISGRDDYSLPGYFQGSGIESPRWKYYFSRAEANNCVVINPSEHPGQNISSNSGIDTFVSKDRGAFAVTDLTDSYKDWVHSYKRGFMLCDDRTKFVLQDEIVMKKPYEMYSFINFKASDFEITEEGDVIVTKGNRKMYVNIICDVPYEVKIMSAKALPTSEILPGERWIRELKKVAIHFKSAEKVNLKVMMTPYLFDEELDKCKEEEYIPINEWNIEDGTLSSPVLKGLTLDGKTVENFNPYNRCYFIKDGDVFPEKIEAEVDDALYDVSVIRVDDIYKIIVTDKNDKEKLNTYMVSYDDSLTKVQFIDTSNMQKVEIGKISASADDGNVPQNTVDGDFSTRWSAEGEHTITFELKKEASISCVAVAFYSGASRQSYFDIEFSMDGKKWETIDNIETSGKTEEMEYYSTKNKRAKYVRIHGYGNSTSKWNSISEVMIYSN